MKAHYSGASLHVSSVSPVPLGKSPIQMQPRARRSTHRGSPSDAEFVNVTGLWWHTREEIRKAHAYGLNRIFKESLPTATDVRVKWLSDEIAVVHARMNLNGQSPVNDIRAPRQRSNVMSLVVHRTTEGWRCASAHNTDVVPGSETNIVDDQGRLRSVTYRDRP